MYYPLAVVLLPAVAHRPAAPLPTATADTTVPSASTLRKGSDETRARTPGPAPSAREGKLRPPPAMEAVAVTGGCP